MPLVISHGVIKVVIRYRASRRHVEVSVEQTIVLINLDTLTVVSVRGASPSTANVAIALQEVKDNFALLDYEWDVINP